MDQVRISTEIPINKWNRKRLPTELMAQLFSGENNKSMKRFYSDLEASVRKKESERMSLMKAQLGKANVEYENSNHFETIRLLTNVIRKAARKSNTLKEALRMRAKIFVKSENYEQAIIDHELQMKEFSESNQQLEEIAYLIECYLMLGCCGKVQEYLAEFKQIFDMRFKQDSKHLNRLKDVSKGDDNDKIKRKFEDFISKTENNIMQMKYKRMRPKVDNSTNFHPYKGFNKNKKIKHSSEACSLVVQNGKQMILANRVIPKGEIVIVESPYLRQQVGKPLNCDTCFSTNIASFPCFECHFKSYCSYECKISDEKLHEFECIGYKWLVLPMLKCELLFRVLMNCLILLKSNTSHRYIIWKCNNAANLYKNYMKMAPAMPGNILVGDNDIDYEGFPEAEYELMVLNAYRLTIFIFEYTTIISDFFHDIDIGDEEIQIFLAALILYLNAKIITTSFRINTNANEVEPDQTYDSKVNIESFTPNELRANYIDFKRNIFQNFGFDEDRIKYDANCRIHEAFNKYWDDKVFEPVIKYDCVSKRSVSQDIVEIWMDDEGTEELPSVIGLYLTTLKFNHSCDPNMRLIYLSSGTLIVKACREIRIGEHLTVSYGCHYKNVDKESRILCTNKFNISCLCDYCNGKFNPYFVENVLCIHCNSLASPSELNCVVCGNDMRKTNIVYKNLIYEMEYDSAIFTDNKIQTFYNIIFPLIVYERILPETNYMFVGKLIMLAEFLASENFFCEAYFLIIKIKEIIEKIYLETSVDLLYAYNIILNISLNILLNCLGSLKRTIGHFLVNVYDYTIKLIETMIDINDFNILYDSFTCQILSKYQLILNLKVKIYDSLVYADIYETIIANMKFITKQNSIKPLLQSVEENKKEEKRNNNNFIETRIFTNSFVASRIVNAKDSHKLYDYSSEHNYNLKNGHSDKKSIETTNVGVVSNENCAYQQKCSNRAKSNFTVRKSKMEIFIEECEMYFVKMIEERIGSVYFLSS